MDSMVAYLSHALWWSYGQLYPAPIGPNLLEKNREDNYSFSLFTTVCIIVLAVDTSLAKTWNSHYYMNLYHQDKY